MGRPRTALLTAILIIQQTFQNIAVAVTLLGTRAPFVKLQMSVVSRMKRFGGSFLLLFVAKWHVLERITLVVSTLARFLRHLDRAGGARPVLYFSIGAPIRLPHSVHDPS
jgi:hypothetical protein